MRTSCKNWEPATALYNHRTIVSPQSTSWNWEWGRRRGDNGLAPHHGTAEPWEGQGAALKDPLRWSLCAHLGFFWQLLRGETWAGGRMVHQRHQNMHKSVPSSVIASTLWNASRARLTSVQEKAIKEKEKWLRKILPMISWGQGGVGVWENIFWTTGNNSSITQNRY